MDYNKTSGYAHPDVSHNKVQNIDFSVYIYITLTVLQDEFIKQGEAEMADAFLQKCFI